MPSQLDPSPWRAKEKPFVSRKGTAGFLYLPCPDTDLNEDIKILSIATHFGVSWKRNSLCDVCSCRIGNWAIGNRSSEKPSSCTQLTCFLKSSKLSTCSKNQNMTSQFPRKNTFTYSLLRGIGDHLTTFGLGAFYGWPKAFMHHESHLLSRTYKVKCPKKNYYSVKSRSNIEIIQK